MKHYKPWALSLIIVFLLLSFCGCGAKDLTAGKTPQEIVLASSEAMQDITSYAFTMNGVFSFPIPEQDSPMEIKMTGSGASSVKPMNAHLDMNIDMGSMAMKTELYMLEQENKFIEYMKMPPSGQWVKIEIPLDENSKQLFDPANSLDIIKESLVDAKYLSDEKIDNVPYSKLEVTISPEAALKILQTTSSPLPMAELSQAVSAMGDITYIMWIRKDNLWSTKMEMDLSNMIKNLLGSEISLQETDQLKAVIMMELKDIGKPVDISVPDEVINSAQDLTSTLPQ